MTTPPASEPERRDTCCGQGGAWSSPEGGPLVAGCMTCSRSSTYWRLPENRDDGKPYVEVQPLTEAGDATG